MVRALATLPLFPTRTWCVKAAQHLSPVLSEALIATAIVEDHSVRNLMNVPVVGVACGTARARRWNTALVPKIEFRLASGRWKTLAEPGQHEARLLASGQIDPRELVFEPGDYEFGLLACAVPAGAPSRGRRLVLHAAFDRPHRTPLPAVQVIMRQLGEIASAAFPEHLEYGDLVTDREEEVVALLMRGLTVQEISKHLERSPHTIHDHIKKVHVKTGVTNRGELVARALGHVPPAVAKAAPRRTRARRRADPST
ncbi:MAG TPA: LuxR C-terminal-related transcriptional regulator [Phycisphaerales bacterium]|nr:LuxR C-terminal-related transcriptional regulator [Phycisphaerales bacterium]